MCWLTSNTFWASGVSLLRRKTMLPFVRFGGCEEGTQISISVVVCCVLCYRSYGKTCDKQRGWPD